jgi:hypothetical protein
VRQLQPSNVGRNLFGTLLEKETAMPPWLSKDKVGERYTRTARWVDIETAAGRLPKPKYRGRMPFWDEPELDECDRVSMTDKPIKTTAA